MRLLLLPLPAAAQIFQQGPVRTRAFQSPEMTGHGIESGPSSIGLTLHIEPALRVTDERSGERGLGWGFENRLILDTALVPDKLFAVANLICDIESFRPNGSSGGGGPTERASTGGLSGALSYQLRPGLFLGADLRYLRAHDGLAFDRFRGWAVFAGPTLFWHVNDSVWLSAAWSVQRAGREQGAAGPLDLANFPRHMLKFKLGVEF